MEISRVKQKNDETINSLTLFVYFCMRKNVFLSVQIGCIIIL